MQILERYELTVLGSGLRSKEKSPFSEIIGSSDNA